MPCPRPNIAKKQEASASRFVGFGTVTATAGAPGSAGSHPCSPEWLLCAAGASRQCSVRGKMQETIEACHMSTGGPQCKLQLRRALKDMRDPSLPGSLLLPSTFMSLPMRSSQMEGTPDASSLSPGSVSPNVRSGDTSARVRVRRQTIKLFVS